MIQLENMIREILANNERIIDALPEQANGENTVERKQNSIYVRRAFQQSVSPYILILPPHSYDHGNTCNETLDQKQAELRLIIASKRSLSEIAQLRHILVGDAAEQGEIDKLRFASYTDEDDVVHYIQVVHIVDVTCSDGRSVDGGEEGLPAWQIILKVAFT